MTYLERTRHPWTSVAFVVPLLFAYEVGLHTISPQADDLRTGADVWVRDMLGRVGFGHPLIAPALLVTLWAAWGLRSPRVEWRDPVGSLVGMSAEAVVFAGLLFGLVRLVYPALATVGGAIQEPLARASALALSDVAAPEATWEKILRYMGAGIYEETLFRLLFFSAVRALFVLGDYAEPWPSLAAGLLSAILFAWAHEWGHDSHATLFLYRTVAGLYFAALFRLRGFGVAVGAHAGYDVLVGLILR